MCNGNSPILLQHTVQFLSQSNPLKYKCRPSFYLLCYRLNVCVFSAFRVFVYINLTKITFILVCLRVLVTKQLYNYHLEVFLDHLI